MDLQITDMAVAAYLKLKGFQIEGIVPTQNGAYAFVFKDDPEIEKLVIEYINSDFARFDAALRSIKKLVYSAKERDRKELQKGSKIKIGR